MLYTLYTLVHICDASLAPARRVPSKADLGPHNLIYRRQAIGNRVSDVPQEWSAGGRAQGIMSSSSEGEETRCALCARCARTAGQVATRRGTKPQQAGPFTLIR